MTNSKLHDVIPNSLVIWITILAAFFMVPVFENLWAARDWTFGVFLFLAILDVVVIIIVLVLIYRIFKRKMEELRIVVITIILSVSLTSLFGDEIMEVLIQDFLLGIILLIALLPLVVLYVFIYYRGFGRMIRPKKARIRRAKTHNSRSRNPRR